MSDGKDDVDARNAAWLSRREERLRKIEPHAKNLIISIGDVGHIVQTPVPVGLREEWLEALRKEVPDICKKLEAEMAERAKNADAGNPEEWLKERMKEESLKLLRKTLPDDVCKEIETEIAKNAETEKPKP